MKFAVYSSNVRKDISYTFLNIFFPENILHFVNILWVFLLKNLLFNKTKKKIVYVSSVCLLSFEEAVLQLHSPWHKIQDGCYLHVKIYHNDDNKLYEMIW